MRQGGEPVHAGHRQIEEDELAGAACRASVIASCPSARLADDVEAVLPEERGQRLARQWVIVGDQDALHMGLIGSTRPAD